MGEGLFNRLSPLQGLNSTPENVFSETNLRMCFENRKSHGSGGTNYKPLKL